MKNMGMKVSETEFEDLIKSLPVDGECVGSHNPKSTGTRVLVLFGWFFYCGGGSRFLFINLLFLVIFFGNIICE